MENYEVIGVICCELSSLVTAIAPFMSLAELPMLGYAKSPKLDATQVQHDFYVKMSISDV